MLPQRLQQQRRKKSMRNPCTQMGSLLRPHSPLSSNPNHSHSPFIATSPDRPTTSPSSILAQCIPSRTFGLPPPTPKKRERERTLCDERRYCTHEIHDKTKVTAKRKWRKKLCREKNVCIYGKMGKKNERRKKEYGRKYCT